MSVLNHFSRQNKPSLLPVCYTFSWMEVKGPLLLLHAPSLPVNATTHSWRKRHYLLFWGLRNFTNTSTVASLISSPTTKHFLQFWDQRMVYHLWPLSGCNIGPYFSLPMKYSLRVHKNTQMLMVCLAYRYLLMMMLQRSPQEQPQCLTSH